MTQHGTKRIKTNRLVLRKILPTDLINVLKWYCHPELNKFFIARTQNTKFDAFRMVFGKITKYQSNDYYCWGITKDKKMIGMIQAMKMEADDTYALYYMLDLSLNAKGYMSEAVKAVIEYLKSENAKKIYASSDINNIGSIKVMKNAGMKKSEKAIPTTLNYKDGRKSHTVTYYINLKK